MNTPLFSIIIPIYKVRQDYLEICIESIRNQSFQNIEIIMVDVRIIAVSCAMIMRRKIAVLGLYIKLIKEFLLPAMPV